MYIIKFYYEIILVAMYENHKSNRDIRVCVPTASDMRGMMTQNAATPHARSQA